MTGRRVAMTAGRLLPALLFLGLAGVIVMCAWQSDDAYVTFRTVRNAWEGHGLTWNPGERVQAYTHPLWMVVGLAAYGLTRDVYYSMLAVSVACAWIAAWLAARPLAGRPWLAPVGILVLGASGAFVDYSTSGLENPLLYLLLVLIVRSLRNEPTPGRLLRLALLVSAVGLTRMDALLIALPVALRWWWALRGTPGALGPMVAGLAPLAAWEAFSLVYYGSLVPNSALAKLNVEIPLALLARQGALYFADSLSRDPVTLAVIVLTLALGLRRAAAPYRPLLAGIGLYLLYILRIGGDFMSGRFFAAPFVASVAVLAAMAAERAWGARVTRGLAPALAGALIVFGLAWPGTRWTSGTEFGVGRGFGNIVGPSGIADERAYYYPTTGLARLVAHRDAWRRTGAPLPPYPGAVMGARFARSHDPVAVWDEAGFFGYFAGGKIVLDLWALGDPLLARIPFRPQGAWRIGHYPRALPAGYLESRREGRNLLRDPGLAACYDGLALVTRGPLFTAPRWREIWRLHTGHYAAALERQAGGGS